MAIDYAIEAGNRAKHLAEFLGFTVDHEVLVCSDGYDSMTVKFIDTSGKAEPLYVSGTTYRDLYMSLCAIEEAISFTTVAGMSDWLD